MSGVSIANAQMHSDDSLLLSFLLFPWAVSPRTSSVGKAGTYIRDGHRPPVACQGQASPVRPDRSIGLPSSDEAYEWVEY